MKKILLVDDSKAILNILEKGLINTIKKVEVLKASTYKEAVKLVLQHGNTIFLAILDLDLPDSKKGGIIDVVEAHDIKSIVLSAHLDEISKKIIFTKKCIIDCIAKDGKKSIKNVVTSVYREIKNINKNILVVDDSKMQVSTITKILKRMNLSVTVASDGKEAYDLIRKGDIKFSLVLTDYHMPKMDGMELTFRLRELYDKDELSILVLSSNNTPEIAAEFLKIGANDYINKPFLESEVITRINANLDLIDLFEKTRELANKDFLTGLYNRRYFFEFAAVLLKKAKRDKKLISFAMLDIDKFKNINDTYGHAAGDIAICEVADILNNHLLRESDIVARFGGEEFCLLIDNITKEDTEKFF